MPHHRPARRRRRFGHPFRSCFFPDRGTATTPFAPLSNDIGTRSLSVQIWSADRRIAAISPPSATCPATFCRHQNFCPHPTSPSWVGFVNVRPDRDGSRATGFLPHPPIGVLRPPPTRDSEELLSLPARGLEKTGLFDRVPCDPPASQCFASRRNSASLALRDICGRPVEGAAVQQRRVFSQGKIVLIGAADNPPRIASKPPTAQ